MLFIFLDVDGVLNDEKYITKMHNKYRRKIFWTSNTI